MFLDVPDGNDPITHVWGYMVPGIGPAAAAFSAAVYEHSSLGLEEFEAARLRIAQVNGCMFCLDWRTDRDGETVPDWFMGEVENWRESGRLDERSKLAAEFAERFALDHRGIDDEFWSRLRAAYTDEELVELAMSVGSWLTFGRINRVFGLDAACTLPGPAHSPGSGLGE
ncbi:MAG: carboxymuconolactone decarboxylase family protein [Actinomycetia bacterium]|nr:carboxymuconolactone decarboxylase family protein [Actinomycetes bacterium]